MGAPSPRSPKGRKVALSSAIVKSALSSGSQSSRTEDALRDR